MASNTTFVDTTGKGVTPNESGHNIQTDNGTNVEDSINEEPKDNGTNAEDIIFGKPKNVIRPIDQGSSSSGSTGPVIQMTLLKNTSENQGSSSPGSTEPAEQMNLLENPSENQGSSSPGLTEPAKQMTQLENPSDNQGSSSPGLTEPAKQMTQLENPSDNQKKCAHTCGDVTSIVGIGGGFVLAASKVVLMVVVGLLISTSMDISKVKTCELENALNSLNLEYSPYPCKYKAITGESRDLKYFGFGALSSNFVLLILILCTMFCAYMCRKHNECISCFFYVTWILVFINGIIVSYVSYCNHSKIVEVTKEQPNVDYAKLQLKMVNMLEQQYLSDNFSTSDSNSRNWNNFFIQFDCCAVREVPGTTNDFDNTPWCTTNGTCQETASQIPKTCCKDVTQDDYQNAPSACHASVNPGTYKPSCISRIRGMSTENINEFQLTAVTSSLFVLFVFQVFESAFAFVGILVTVICYKILCKKEPTTDNQSDPTSV
uniref:Uncharacterized protein LOC111124602 isoform X3 n=1 Tax=Crassostrea virginica TaxID=6565 RepID=A0A8B8D8V9_CRAVI|nr:uncharacterized protein LOC111124602 isoform X3 [Crassostrea virginica]